MHVVGPQLGLTQPGITVVCGDSHTSTHGAFGAMAFGIGTSEVEHVMATQTLPLKPFKTMAINVEGDAAPRRHREGHHPRRHREDRHRRRPGLRARVPRQRHPRALDGRPHDDLQHVDRGRRPRRHGRARRDDLRLPEGSRPRPAGRRLGRGGRLLAHAARPTRARSSTPRSSSTPNQLEPFVTWGTNPGQGVLAQRRRARPRVDRRPERARRRRARARVHGPRAGHAAEGDRRSTPSSWAPARTAASKTCAPSPSIIEGKQKADGVRVMVVPGSARVRLEAEAEGLDKVFKDFGAEWRFAGCSMCLGMNPDQLAPGRALRVDLEPQLRGSPGQGRAHAPRVAARRRGDRHPRHAVEPVGSRAGSARRRAHRSIGTTARRRPDHGEDQHRHRHRRAAAPLERRHRPDHPRRLPQARHEDGLRRRAVLRLAPGPEFVLNQPPYRQGARSSSPAPTSAPDRAASTPCGRCATSASRRRARARASATSSAATPASRACSPAQVAERTWSALGGRRGRTRE